MQDLSKNTKAFHGVTEQFPVQATAHSAFGSKARYLNVWKYIGETET